MCMDDIPGPIADRPSQGRAKSSMAPWLEGPGYMWTPPLTGFCSGRESEKKFSGRSASRSSMESSGLQLLGAGSNRSSGKGVTLFCADIGSSVGVVPPHCRGGPARSMTGDSRLASQACPCGGIWGGVVDVLMLLGLLTTSDTWLCGDECPSGLARPSCVKLGSLDADGRDPVRDEVDGPTWLSKGDRQGFFSWPSGCIQCMGCVCTLHVKLQQCHVRVTGHPGQTTSQAQGR
jgi:hypothetical protein